MGRNHGQTADISVGGESAIKETVDTPRANVRCAAALLRALAAAGVRHIAISSGARCAPLIAAVANNPHFKLWTHFDERSAAFTALGVGKATRTPAVMICTSGTAGANYYPAVIEARMSGTPMIVITADRPPYLRGKGASQTIDQRDLFGHFALASYDLPLPKEDVESQWAQETTRALECCQGHPAGPVHLNTPFGEPLLPVPQNLQSAMAHIKTVESNPDRASWPRIETRTWADITTAFGQARRPLIICGPQNTCDALADIVQRLAQHWGAAVIADIASGVRLAKLSSTQETSVDHHSLILHDQNFREALRPDAVLRLGGLPTSKSLNSWISTLGCPAIAVDDHEIVADPDDCSSIKLQSELSSFVEDLLKHAGQWAKPDAAYVRLWKSADRIVKELLNERLNQASHPDNSIFEGDIVRMAFDTAPDGMMFFLSNGLPIRLADAYVCSHRKGLRVLGNRGVNGIDGVTSTAIGIARATGNLTTLIIGDMAFWHDANGLAGLQDEKLTIVLINNKGGGIFSFVPIARHTDFFDPLIAMPHTKEFCGLANWYGVRHVRLMKSHEFESTYRNAINSNRPTIIEVVTDRHKTRKEIHAIDDAVSNRLAEIQRSIG